MAAGCVLACPPRHLLAFWCYVLEVRVARASAPMLRLTAVLVSGRVTVCRGSPLARCPGRYLPVRPAYGCCALESLIEGHLNKNSRLTHNSRMFISRFKLLKVLRLFKYKRLNQTWELFQRSNPPIRSYEVLIIFYLFTFFMFSPA